MNDDSVIFHTDLMQEVAATAVATGALTRTALVENLAARLVNSEEFQDWTPCYFEGRGSRKRILEMDGYTAEDLDLDGTVQVLTAVLYVNESVEPLSATDINTASTRAIAFVTDARSGILHDEIEPSTPAADFARVLFNARDSIRTLRILVLSNGTLGPRYREVERNSIDGIRVEVHIWDIARFQKLADKGGHEPIELEIARLVPDGIPKLTAGIDNTEYGAYLCVVPGAFLADIYEEYGSRILEGNVRSFLSARALNFRPSRSNSRTLKNECFCYRIQRTRSLPRQISLSLKTLGRKCRILSAPAHRRIS